MKKLTAILMALILTLSFTALAEETPAPAADTPESTSNILVVYFSATGNIPSRRHLIAEATGADVFKLEPVEPYTDADLTGRTRAAASFTNSKTPTTAMWNWSPIPWKTGISTTPFSSAIPSGGASPPGR